jgi:cyanophycin synthetase
MAAINDTPSTWPPPWRTDRLVDRYCLGPSTAHIVDAATERRIPSIRLTDGNLVQLGHGAASAASGPPKPTAPAPSPKASPATRT